MNEESAVVLQYWLQFNGNSGGGQRFNIEIEQEEDGRWIAEIPELPGVMVYGATRQEAQSKVEALANRVVADRV